MKSYRVCSDHFRDTDYEPHQLLKFRTLSQNLSEQNLDIGKIPPTRLRLKSTAVPNTHPERDELQLILNGQIVSAGEEVNVAAKRRRLNRNIYSLTIENEHKRLNYLKAELTNQKLRYLAYRVFLNILSCDDFDRRVRYVLPSCVVKAIRNAFPNPDGVPYRGFVSISSNDGRSLP